MRGARSPCRSASFDGGIESCSSSSPVSSTLETGIVDGKGAEENPDGASHVKHDIVEVWPVHHSGPMLPQPIFIIERVLKRDQAQSIGTPVEVCSVS